MIQPAKVADTMTYALATSRPWNQILATRLSERTGQPFHLITRQEELTPERLREINPRMVFFPHWSYLIRPPSTSTGTASSST